MKKIVTIQDISCVGKCSLTVALPIISAMGIETAIIPTAVLSTHTMFKGFTFHDLTGEISPICEHWKKEGIDFAAIYTGYLGSFEQISLMKKMFDDFGKNSLKFVDPAMGDNGKLYPGFTPEFAKEMLNLCAKADICVPNMTEISFMLGHEYREDGEYDEEYIKHVLKELHLRGTKVPIMTGVSFEEGKTGAMGYDGENDKFFSYFNDKLPVKYHGTGDIFSSVCVGALVNGKSYTEAIKLAADFTKESIAITLDDPDHPTYGVNFEKAIKMLV